MRIDMSPILTGRTDTIPFAFEYEAEVEMFSGLTLDKPVHIEGNVKSTVGCMLLTLRADVSYTTSCARCLKEIKRSLSFELSKNAAVSGTLFDEDNDEYVIIENSSLVLDEQIDELLFLELPSRDLCKEDCLGLCPKCGKDLNDGKCSCVTKEIDPRLAVLSKFLTENEDDN